MLLGASLGGAGHLEPVLAVARDLAASGAAPTLLVPPSLEAAARASGLPVALGADPPAERVAAIRAQMAEGPPARVAGLVDRELFARLATRAMLPAARGAVDAGVALVLREPTEYASAVAGVEAGVDVATLAISQATVEADVLKMVAPLLDEIGPGVVARLREAAYLTAFPATIDPSPWRRTLRYRTSVAAPSDPEDDGDAPVLYATFGSVLGHTDRATPVLRDALAVLDELGVRAVLTTGRAVDPETLGPIPPTVRVARWVPQDQVLRTASAVLCHGGSGTVLGALRAGVPIVVCPLYADNARNGRAVANAGAGLLAEPLGTGDGGARRAARDALRTLLSDGAFASAARDLAAELVAHPMAATVVAELLGAPGRPSSG